jgi:glycosyltransferase involved in cell wall biosynthesis
LLRPLRIAQVAPPLEPVPPRAYGGTERVVESLVVGLSHRGHDVTTFASGDSSVPGRLVPTVEQALWPAGYTGDASPFYVATIAKLLEHAGEFDLVHAHLEWYNPLIARLVDVPVVATFHGRLDVPWAADLLAAGSCLPVGISRSQVGLLPHAPWAGVVHNGLVLEGMPFGHDRSDSVCFVGRVAPEKGIVDAIDVALAAGRPLRIAAKVGSHQQDLAYYESVFRPALRRAGRTVEYLGELGREDRDRLFVESYATLMPGGWPEPFGLVAIESLACGTPLVARPAGALPEIIRDGVDGFFGNEVSGLARLLARVDTLDREEIRRSVIGRFSAETMVARYEEVYCRALETSAVAGAGTVASRWGQDDEQSQKAIEGAWRLPTAAPAPATGLNGRARAVADVTSGSRARD